MPEGFPYAEMMKKPYVVLYDPESGRGAAYNGQHKLMGDASPALVRFALERHTHKADWRDERDDPRRPRERPDWMTKGSLTGWTLYWLRSGGVTAEHLRDTPDR